MNTTPELSGIIITGLDPAPRPPLPPNWFNRVANRIFNLARRPLVRARTREVQKIAQLLHLAIIASLIPDLEASAKSCPICRFNMMNLQAEVFASSMKRVLTFGKCRRHAEPYERFSARYRDDFDKSEKFSAWINGF
jgi:hypothetical protein